MSCGGTVSELGSRGSFDERESNVVWSRGHEGAYLHAFGSRLAGRRQVLARGDVLLPAAQAQQPLAVLAQRFEPQRDGALIGPEDLVALVVDLAVLPIAAWVSAEEKL